MTRAAIFTLLLVPLASMAQTTEIIDRALLRQTICGPVRVQAQMLDTSLDGLVEPHQAVSFTLNNLKSIPIVLERVTLHYGGETPTSGAPFESESRVRVGAGREVLFAKYTTVPNPVSYVELDFVKYADGSSWHPSAGEVCKIIPIP
jgi:hypothetical protein